MKKTLSQINKDLDLRRFGKDVYTKASQEGGGGSGSSQSGEITLDDVVKFIHDDALASTHDENNFPYTTYDEIPEYDGHSYANGIFRMPLEIFESAAGAILPYLYTPSGIIADVSNAPSRIY